MDGRRKAGTLDTCHICHVRRADAPYGLIRPTALLDRTDDGSRYTCGYSPRAWRVQARDALNVGLALIASPYRRSRVVGRHNPHKVQTGLYPNVA